MLFHHSRSRLCSFSSPSLSCAALLSAASRCPRVGRVALVCRCLQASCGSRTSEKREKSSPVPLLSSSSLSRQSNTPTHTHTHNTHTHTQPRTHMRAHTLAGALLNLPLTRSPHIPSALLQLSRDQRRRTAQTPQCHVARAAPQQRGTMDDRLRRR